MGEILQKQILKTGTRILLLVVWQMPGFSLPLSKNIYLNTGLRFDYDFTNAEDDSYRGYTAGRAKTYNSSLGLEVGLKYQLR